MEDPAYWETRVVSLETAKKLKAAKFKMEWSYWIWRDELKFRDGKDGIEKHTEWVIHTAIWKEKDHPCYPAPIAEEIAEQLPVTIEKDDAVYNLTLDLLRHAGTEREWWACYEYYDLSMHDFSGPTMAEALAALWLKLHDK